VVLSSFIMAVFQPAVIYDGVHFSDISAEFTIRYHFDKAVVGFVLLAFLYKRVNRWREWKEVGRNILPIYIVTMLAVLFLGMMLGYFVYDPKLSSLILWWGVGNLFITCIAEEAFFRLLIQAPLQDGLKKIRFGAVIALIITSILFGLVHAGGGWIMVLGATLAGLGYGYAYLRTGRVEAAILLHFALNLTHFLFFAYPRALSLAI